MADPAPPSPPLPGNWLEGETPRTGPWTVGRVWIDGAAGRYAMLVEERHCNATGFMHGGALATFLDAQAFVVIDATLAERHTPTITLGIDFLAPVCAGDWLVAQVELVKVTRSMIVSRALATVGDRVVARSNAIYSNTSGKDAR